MALTRSNDPLVWVDCEITGLDPDKDNILSIACFITDANLVMVEPNGFEAIIGHSKSVLDSMSAWCIEHHGQSGLTEACLNSNTTADEAAAGLLDYIKLHVSEPRTALLAGNSIHADKMFLMKPPWDRVLEHLHYRLFDVSAIKEAMRRWAPTNLLDTAPQKQLKHTAKEDILESIEEARYYRKYFVTMRNSS